MKKSLFLLLSLACVLHAYSQTRTISGTVVEHTSNEAIQLASIRILNAKDSTYIAGTATNKEGKFSINVPKAQYITQISFLGFANEYVPTNVQQGNANLGTIHLTEEEISLGEAIITGKAAEITVKGDTVEYNASSYKVQESAVVEDLLKKMPGVEVDKEGKITVNGKEVKKILVDGKEFFSDDPKVASKNLPAAMVNKLQVLDRKSDMAQMTGFDDGNDETVINLTVKAGMKQGTFGNGYIGYGSKDRYEGNGMVSYMKDNTKMVVLGGSNNTNNAGASDLGSSTFGGMRPSRGMNFGGGSGIIQSSNGGFNFSTEYGKKLKWGGDVSYNKSNTDVASNSYTQNLDAKNGNSYQNTAAWGRNESDNMNLNLRFEFQPDTLTKIIFRPTMRYSTNRNWQNTDFLTTAADVTDSINWGNSNYYSDGTSSQLNGSLELSRKLSKTGRVISFGFTGGLSESDSKGTNWSITDYKLSNEEKIDQRINQNNDGYNWRAYTSYVEPIGKNNFLQLSYSYRKNHSLSDKQTFRKDILGIYNEIDTAYTKKLVNDFLNQEIALNFKSVRAKYDYSLGVVMQPASSQSNTYRVDSLSQVKTTVVNIAPSVQFNYRWDKQTNLRIDYNGSTNQPSTSQLSDVENITDPLNTTRGNPNLKPSFDNRLNFRFRSFDPLKSRMISASAQVSNTINAIVTYSTIDADRKRRTTYENINGNLGGNVRLMFNTPLSNKKFSVNAMSMASYGRTNGFVNGDKNTANKVVFQENVGIDYRSTIFDVGMRANLTSNKLENTLPGQRKETTYDYGGNVNTTIYLPLNFTIESDLNYATNSGYSSGFEKNEFLWNASFSKQIFKAKNGTIRLKMYDILQNRSNISRREDTYSITDVTSNSINSYVMLHFVYKFQLFKGSTKRTDMEEPNQRGPEPPRGEGRGRGGEGRF